MSAGELRLRCRLVSLMSGKLRYPRSMQASCLGSPWQSLRSTDFPRLLEALTRWYCQVLTSLYFDAAITDVRSAKGSGQWAMKQLCLMIGSLFAEDKTQTMQSTGASLGLTHDLSCINKTGHVRFRPAPDSMAKFVMSCHSTSSRPLYSRHSFQTLWTCNLLGARYFWASRVWRSHGHQGTQLELSMVLCALIERPDLFRHRHGLWFLDNVAAVMTFWFLDNVAAVMTLVRGRSSNSGLAKLGHLIHLALFALRAQHLRVPNTCHAYELTF